MTMGRTDDGSPHSHMKTFASPNSIGLEAK